MTSTLAQEAVFSQRSELKFEISEAQADRIRSLIQVRLRPDPFGSMGSYPVCSVYLDSHEGTLYSQTCEGLRNRFKLRVRFYSPNSKHPAFLEVKRRSGSSILKQRARVGRSTAEKILNNGSPDMSKDANWLGERASDFSAYQEFMRLRDSIHAVGTTYVYYHREAFVSPESSRLRATFDRHLIAQHYEPGMPLEIPHRGIRTQAHGKVVFEVKFTDRYPVWMEDLIRECNLAAGPFPKYVTCRDSVVDLKRGCTT